MYKRIALVVAAALALAPPAPVLAQESSPSPTSPVPTPHADCAPRIVDRAIPEPLWLTPPTGEAVARVEIHGKASESPAPTYLYGYVRPVTGTPTYGLLAQGMSDENGVAVLE